MQGFLQHPTAPTNPYLLGLLTDLQTPLPFKWDTSASIKVFFDDTGARAWTETEKAAAFAAFGYWQKVANISFEVTTIRAQAEIIQTLNTSTENLGVADLPGGTPPSSIQYSTAGTSFDTINLGGDTFETLVHEIGHSIGLSHPHDGVVFPGVTGEQSSGDGGHNQQIWTVMSYVVGYNQEPTTTQQYGTSFTPMAFDIAAAQFLYGAKAAEVGDNTYLLPLANQTGTGWSSIWDTGGIDTISGAAATTALTINLNEAPLTGPNAGGFVSWLTGIKGGFTIANGVVIENAIGGAGADTLIGNSANNVLTGGGGNDTIDAGGGIDTVRFSGNRADYTLAKAVDETYTVTDNTVGRDGVDTIRNAEKFQFLDQVFDAASAPPQASNGTRDSLYDISRFFNTATGAHFYTANDAERDTLIASGGAFAYEGNSFDSNATMATGIVVFRLFNTQTGVHFYTASAEERASIAANLPQFNDEGEAYYAYADGGAGRQALHRFFNTANGTHFFTASDAEQQQVVSTLPQYRYEGIAYYVEIA